MFALGVYFSNLGKLSFPQKHELHYMTEQDKHV